MIGLITSDIAVTFPSRKHLGNIHKVKRTLAKPKINLCVGTVSPARNLPLLLRQAQIKVNSRLKTSIRRLI